MLAQIKMRPLQCGRGSRHDGSEHGATVWEEQRYQRATFDMRVHSSNPHLETSPWRQTCQDTGYSHEDLLWYDLRAVELELRKGHRWRGVRSYSECLTAFCTRLALQLQTWMSIRFWRNSVAKRRSQLQGSTSGLLRTSLKRLDKRRDTEPWPNTPTWRSPNSCSRAPRQRVRRKRTKRREKEKRVKKPKLILLESGGQ